MSNEDADAVLASLDMLGGLDGIDPETRKHNSRNPYFLQGRLPPGYVDRYQVADILEMHPDKIVYWRSLAQRRMKGQIKFPSRDPILALTWAFPESEVWRERHRRIVEGKITPLRDDPAFLYDVEPRIHERARLRRENPPRRQSKPAKPSTRPETPQGQRRSPGPPKADLGRVHYAPMDYETRRDRENAARRKPRPPEGLDEDGEPLSKEKARRRKPRQG